MLGRRKLIDCLERKFCQTKNNRAAVLKLFSRFPFSDQIQPWCTVVNITKDRTKKKILYIFNYLL